jgi:hypothetical protein
MSETMKKLDWKKDQKDVYNPPKDPVVIDVPPINYLMLDGHGDPNNNPHYQAVIESLYAVAYNLKFAIKKAERVDYAVYPAEGLWWVPDMNKFDIAHKEDWDWTMMIAQPEMVTPEWVAKARAEALKKKGLALIEQVRFETYREGLSAQVMHTGPFSAEGPVIARLHEFIRAQGGEMNSKHHEIYLSDFRRTAPEKLRTVIRQPFRKA